MRTQSSSRPRQLRDMLECMFLLRETLICLIWRFQRGGGIAGAVCVAEGAGI